LKKKYPRLFSNFLSFSILSLFMSQILERIEPLLLKLEGFILAIAADVPTETDWAQSSYGSW
jgi:hypothetical protein